MCDEDNVFIMSWLNVCDVATTRVCDTLIALNYSLLVWALGPSGKAQVSESGIMKGAFINLHGRHQESEAGRGARARAQGTMEIGVWACRPNVDLIYSPQSFVVCIT